MQYSNSPVSSAFNALLHGHTSENAAAMGDIIHSDGQAVSWVISMSRYIKINNNSINFFSVAYYLIKNVENSKLNSKSSKIYTTMLQDIILKKYEQAEYVFYTAFKEKTNHLNLLPTTVIKPFMLDIKANKFKKAKIVITHLNDIYNKYLRKDNCDYIRLDYSRTHFLLKTIFDYYYAKNYYKITKVKLPWAKMIVSSANADVNRQMSRFEGYLNVDSPYMGPAGDFYFSHSDCISYAKLFEQHLNNQTILVLRRQK